MGGNGCIYPLQNFAPMELSDYERRAITKLGQSIQDGQWSNDGLVQLIAVAIDYINPITITQYSKKYGVSYNGVKHHRPLKTILNRKYFLDNE
jgi:hypothetical protein